MRILRPSVGATVFTGVNLPAGHENGRPADALIAAKRQGDAVAQWVLAVSMFIVGACLAGLWDRRAFTRQRAHYEQALREARAQFDDQVLVERTRADTALSIVDRLTSNSAPVRSDELVTRDGPQSGTLPPILTH